MNRFLLATVGLMGLGITVPASAADLAAHPYTKAPPPIMAAPNSWARSKTRGASKYKLTLAVSMAWLAAAEMQDILDDCRPAVLLKHLDPRPRPEARYRRHQGRLAVEPPWW